jgi:hypothetical protein
MDDLQKEAFVSAFVETARERDWTDDEERYWTLHDLTTEAEAALYDTANRLYDMVKPYLRVEFYSIKNGDEYSVSAAAGVDAWLLMSTGSLVRNRWSEPAGTRFAEVVSSFDKINLELRDGFVRLKQSHRQLSLL